ncbi:MAG: type IV pilus assembly protein PilM [Neisseriaceae bacterium]|nr:type IV pilus assembly protein PilM [Neisseriaceae bacterium]
MSVGNKKTNSLPSLSGRSFVGVDIGDHSIKMVQVSKRSADSVQIESCAITPLPAGVVVGGKINNVDGLISSIQQTVSRMGGVSKNVIFGVPDATATVQNFAYDASSGLDMEGAAEFEAAQMSVIDDINFDYQAVGEVGRNGQNVLLAIAKKEDIEPYLGTLDEAGIPPVLVDVEPVARINAYSYWINQNAPELEKAVVAVFEVGEESTQALVLQNGALLYKQNFSLGGKNFTRELQRASQVSADEAEKMKISANKSQEYQQVAESFNSQLLQEIQRVLQFFYTVASAAQKVERIFLTGGGSQSAGVAEYVTEHSGVKTQLLHPANDVSLSGKVNQEQFKQNAARYTVAFGLALRGLA